jgi:hypothetical protein
MRSIARSMNGLFLDTGQTPACSKHYVARGHIRRNPIKLELLWKLAMTERQPLRQPLLELGVEGSVPIYARHSISDSIGCRRFDSAGTARSCRPGPGTDAQRRGRRHARASPPRTAHWPCRDARPVRRAPRQPVRSCTSTAAGSPIAPSMSSKRRCGSSPNAPESSRTRSSTRWRPREAPDPARGDRVLCAFPGFSR